MHKVLTAVGLALAVPVALAAPALAKPTTSGPASVSSVLSQHEGFRAEVTYLCTGPKHQEGTISVALQQPAGPGPSALITVGTGYEEAKCDGKVRDDKVKIPVPDGAVRADRTVQLYTTLIVNGVEVASDATDAQPVLVVAPSPSPSSSGSPSASPSPSESSESSESPSPSSSLSPSESESPDPETPSPSPTPTS